jgi:hypothetical protein
VNSYQFRGKLIRVPVFLLQSYVIKIIEKIPNIGEKRNLTPRPSPVERGVSNRY